MTVLDMADVRIELSNGDAVIDGIDVRVSSGEILGLVGESGSGKTTTALSIFGYNAPGLKMAEGEIAIAGEPLRTKQAFRDARGRLVSYVPQNPGAALNPALRIADAIEDMVRSEREGHRATDLLERVGLPTITISPGASRISSPEVSSSASASRPRSRRIRFWSCSTSRPPASTSSHRTASSRSFSDYATSSRSRCSTSRTTSRSWPRSPGGSR